jgi:ankyrin repeat protein
LCFYFKKNLIDITESTEVTVMLEEPHESSGINEHRQGVFHGESLCTLEEITAEKNTVLHIAAGHGHVQLVKKIFRERPQDSTLLLWVENSRQETPLHLAARAGHHHMVSLIFLQAQEFRNEIFTKRTFGGDTVLHEAARHGHGDVVEVLMTEAPELSAEVNAASMSPLYLAVVRKSVGVVKALLKCSFASAVGPNQQNALHAAVLGSPGKKNFFSFFFSLSLYNHI